MKAHEDCQSDPKTKVSDDYMRNAVSGKKEDSEANARSHELCMSQKLGLIDEHGKVVKSEVETALGKVIKDTAKLEQAVNKCAVDKDTPKNTGFDLWVCMLEVTKPYAPQLQKHHHHH